MLVIAGEEYHGIAHSIRVDILAFGDFGGDRDHSKVCAYSRRRRVCSMAGSGWLRDSGNRLHCQDGLKLLRADQLRM